MFKLALVSVSDKSGLVEFLRSFVDSGLKVVSTGGTAEHLKKNGIPVIAVSEITKFPEVMDGRVRTLHPNIHMSLLARQYNAEDMDLLKSHGLSPFDLVIGNLYPFEEALKENLPLRELTEYIDIGGPCLLRAAAKNFETITVVSDPADYAWIKEKNGKLDITERKRLAAKVFSHVSSYDAMIFNELSDVADVAKDYAVSGGLVEELRYGENPQQKAYWYRVKGPSHGLHESKILQGKQLSFNNIVDLESASRTLLDFESPTVVAVKHANPCGVARDAKLSMAAQKCVKADPVSVFGGIMAFNREVDQEIAKFLENVFLECIVAPSFSQEAIEIFKRKKNLRLLEWKNICSSSSGYDIKSIRGGFLLQTQDRVSMWSDSWNIIGEKPSDKIKEDMMFAWKVCAHLKSNAIAIVGDGQTLGLGMGQVNRVDAVEHAITRKQVHHKSFSGLAVLASDAFFPFADSIEKISEAGIKWVIQPGGSVRDEEVISKAKACGVNMVLTGVRHFYH